MRAMIVMLSAVLLFPSMVSGKSLYISCYREVTLRAEASQQGKPLAVLKSGQQVSLVGEKDNYYLVTLPNGTRGFLFKDYLTDRPPTEARLREAEARLQEMEQKTQQRIKELEAQAPTQAVDQKAQQRVKDLETQTQQQEKELIALRAERTQLAKQQAEATARLPLSQVEPPQAQPTQYQSSIIERDQTFQWFMAGAGVLLVGWVLGWMDGKHRRRRF